MDPFGTLTADIADLCSQIDLDPQAITRPLAALGRDLEVAVESYVGLQLVLTDHGHPLTLTAFATATGPTDIVSSMFLPLAAMARTAWVADPGSALILYAGRAGAFVDLAADLTYALRLPDPRTRADDEPVDNGMPRIELDRHLIPSSLRSGLDGAAEDSLLNRAIGFLIGEGHHPDDAFGELGRRATAAGITVLAYAAQLIRLGPD